MTVPPSSAPSAGAAAAPLPVPGAVPAAFQRIVDSLGQLAEDGTVPRNIRRGAQSAKDELSKPRVALDLRVASAVYVLDDLANDPNLPTHGRTAIWSIISNLESLQ
ncbi:MAG: UPF0147 family protein [Thermoplasmata archaeon]|jgi:uncharacterized protein (UPF0147 family)|nr:UPF0147 family protein [Thermoplasmata archaeon]